MTELPRVLDVTLSNDGSLSMPPRMLQVVQAVNAPLTNGAHTPQSDAPQRSPVSPLLRGHGGDKRHMAGGSPDSNNYNNNKSNNNNNYSGFPSGGSSGSSSRLLGGHGDAAAASATSREARAAAQSFHTVSLQRGRRRVLCSAEEDADEFVAYHSDAPPTSARSVVRSTVCMDRHIHERMYDDLRRAHQRDNNPESGMPDRGPLFAEVIIKQLQARDAQAGATTSPALSSSSMTGGAMTATTAGAASSASLSSWQAPPPPMLYSSSPTRVTPLSLPQMLPVSGTAVTSASSLSSRAHAHERRSPSGVRHMNSSHSNYTSRNNSPRLPGSRKGGAGGGGVVAGKPSALYAQPSTSTMAAAAASSSSSARASMYNDIVRPAVHMRPYHLPGIDNTDAFIAQEKARNFA